MFFILWLKFSSTYVKQIDSIIDYSSFFNFPHLQSFSSILVGLQWSIMILWSIVERVLLVWLVSVILKVNDLWKAGMLLSFFDLIFFLFAFCEQDFITLKLLDRKTQSTWTSYKKNAWIRLFIKKELSPFCNIYIILIKRSKIISLSKKIRFI